jgi:hypothetical protein
MNENSECILSNAKITSWSNKFSFHRQPSKV